MVPGLMLLITLPGVSYFHDKLRQDNSLSPVPTEIVSKWQCKLCMDSKTSSKISLEQSFSSLWCWRSGRIVACFIIPSETMLLTFVTMIIIAVQAPS